MSEQDYGEKGLSDRDNAMTQRRGLETEPSPAQGETQVEMFLKTVHARREGVRRTLESPRTQNEANSDVYQIAITHAPYDLIDFFRASLHDELDAPNRSKKKFDELKTMENAVVELAAGQSVPPRDLAFTRNYIIEKMHTWHERLNSAVTNEERQAADANILVFKTFLDRLHEPIDTDKDIAGADTVETFANIHTVDEEGDVTVKLNPPENFKNATIKHETSKEALAEIRDGKEVTFDHFSGLFDQVTTDIGKAEERYIAKNPDWVAKKPFVMAADTFYRDHQKEAEDGKLIIVTKSPDGSIDGVGWEPKAKNEPGSVYFTFDPNTPESDELSLMRHVRNVDQFDARRFYVDEARTIMSKVAAGEKVPLGESIKLIQFVENYSGKSEKVKKKMIKFVSKKLNL